MGLDVVSMAIARNYTDKTVTAMDTAYKAADTALDARITELEGVKHTEISTEFIDGLFES